jgi:signal transduction histidine kinase
MKARSSQYLGQAVGLFVVYFITAKLGLSMGAVSGLATAVWPPTGISLVALVLFGYNLWPGIVLGALLVNLSAGAPLLAAGGMAIGNTLEAVLGAYLLQRVVGFRPTLDRLRDVLALVGLAALLSTLVSATLGVTSGWLGGVIPAANVGKAWGAWWLGDMLGDLVLAPLLFAWARRPRIVTSPGRWAEAGALLLSLLAVGLLIFGKLFATTLSRSPYILFPFLIWAALRFGPRGAVTGTFVVSALAIWGTATGAGPFVRPNLGESLLWLQSYMGIVAVTILILGADVAERKEGEASLRQARDQLEIRVQERTVELSHANAELAEEIGERKRAEERLKAFAAALERSNYELQNFASVASHDLQEPLRKIQAFGDRLKTRSGEALDEQGRDYLERMQNAALRMQTLITDLLAFARITTRAQPFVPVALSDIAREVASDLEARIEETGAHLEVGELPTLEGDPLQMRQLLQNLISNALKFHREEEVPVVKLHARPLNGRHPPRADELRTGEWCQLVVEDNGIGFDPKYRDRIFGVFQRLHGRGVYEGTGIGLAICRKIAERHGGSITAQSVPGQGATFLVTMPLTQPEQEILPWTNEETLSPS